VKVALVSYLFDPNLGGGAVASARVLARGLAQQGHEVVVITTHPRRQLAVERGEGITIYRFFPWNLYWVADKDKQPRWKKVPWQLMDIWNPHVFRVVRGILAQERPDIVHVNKLRGLSPSVWAAARAAGKIPVVQTCRDYELLSPEGTLGSTVGSWAQRGAWFIRPYTWARARFSRAVTAATAPSLYTLDTLTQHGFFPKAVTMVIPNSHGLTLEQLNQSFEHAGASHYPTDKTIHVLYLGRLEAAKGVDTLCSAFERLAARFPSLRLDVAGWGALEPSLRERYGTHPQIAFHGPVFGEEKARLLAGCHVVVVPSTWPEVFGNVIVEAYACGKPVIASRAGGIPESVCEGETGWLFPPGDLEALADAIRRVAEDPAGANGMAQACFAAARQYAVECVVGDYAALYREICNPMG